MKLFSENGIRIRSKFGGVKAPNAGFVYTIVNNNQFSGWRVELLMLNYFKSRMLP